MALKAGRVGVAPSEVDPKTGKLIGGYTLPKATASTLGGVKIGDGISVTAAGKISTAVGDGLNIVDGRIIADVGDGLIIDDNKKIASSAHSVSATFLAAGWADDTGGYKAQTLSVTGLKAQYIAAPVVDVILSGSSKASDAAILADYALISVITTGDGSLTAQCVGDAPTGDVPVRLTVWE